MLLSNDCTICVLNVEAVPNTLTSPIILTEPFTVTPLETCVIKEFPRYEVPLQTGIVPIVPTPVVNIEYKFVEPDNIVPPLNVFADNPPVNTLVPDAVIELNEGDAAKFIVGFVAVPPVDRFPFAPTDCTPEPAKAKIEYKFVLPLKMVPPLNVFAERPPVNTLVPDAVIVLTVNAETFTVGKAAVPPV